MKKFIISWRIPGTIIYISGQVWTRPQSSFEISGDERVSLDVGNLVEGINDHP